MIIPLIKIPYLCLITKIRRKNCFLSNFGIRIMPTHNAFTNYEMRDMVCAYAQLNGNGGSVVTRYFKLYLNDNRPNIQFLKTFLVV